MEKHQEHLILQDMLSLNLFTHNISSFKVAIVRSLIFIDYLISSSTKGVFQISKTIEARPTATYLGSQQEDLESIMFFFFGFLIVKASNMLKLAALLTRGLPTLYNSLSFKDIC